MNKSETALFRQFLQDKSMKQNYEWFYEKHRTNPQLSIDQFFELCEPTEAITGAFDTEAEPKSIFTFKYWNTLNKKWLKRLADAKPEQPTAKTEPEPEQLTQAQLTAPKLGEHDATLHYKKKQKMIIFNSVISRQITQGGFTRCYHQLDKNGLFLIFNHKEGANITNVASFRVMLSRVCSAEITRDIATKFKLALGDSYYLHITKNTSRTADHLTVQVLHVRSREEYVKIAARRKEDKTEERIPPAPAPPQQDTGDTETEDLLLEFLDDAEPKTGTTAKKPAMKLSETKAEDILQMLTEKGYITQRDMAVYLARQGWELQEPVVITKLKKFRL